MCCREKFDRHFADNIQEWIKEIIDDYEISDNQILSFSIDSGANITKAVDDYIKNSEKASSKVLDKSFDPDIEENEEENVEDDEVGVEKCVKFTLGGESLDISFENGEITYGRIEMFGLMVRIHCVCHKLQLAVSSFLWFEKKTKVPAPKNHKKKHVWKVLTADKNPFLQVVTKAQKLAAKLRTQVVKVLMNQFYENPTDFLTPLRDQPTRWSSTMNMLDRLLEHKNFCDVYRKNPDFKGKKNF